MGFCGGLGICGCGSERGYRAAVRIDLAKELAERNGRCGHVIGDQICLLAF